jgi:copper chaperone
MEHLNLSIEGMHCGGCVNRVTGALKSIPGVTVEDVQVGSAALTIDPAQTSAMKIAATLKAIGFAARNAGAQ